MRYVFVVPNAVKWCHVNLLNVNLTNDTIFVQWGLNEADMFKSSSILIY